MEQDGAGGDDIMLLDEDNKDHNDDHNDENHNDDEDLQQPPSAVQTHGESQKKSNHPIYRRKYKTQTRTRLAISQDLLKKPRKEKTKSIFPSFSDTAKKARRAKKTRAKHQTHAQTTNKNATSKKGKEKVRDTFEKPRSKIRKPTRTSNKRNTSRQSSSTPSSTSSTTKHSVDDDQHTSLSPDASFAYEILDSDADMPTKVKVSFTTQSDGTQRCIHCGKFLSGGSDYSTKRYHITTSCKALKHNKMPPFSKEEADMLLCRMVAEECLSLRLTDSPKLRTLLSYLRPGYVPPCRTTLTTKLLPRLKDSLKHAIACKLKSIEHMSISYDGWTSIALRKYIALLCHGITSDWTLETFMLKVIPITESETAEFIADVVRDTLDEWNIPFTAVMAAATDGAPNMKCSVEKNLEVPWIYCIAHAINRSVFNSLERNNPLKQMLCRATTLCTEFKYNSALKAGLRKRQERLGLSTKNLKLWCPTRWGSINKMLKRMIASRSAIAAYLSDHDVPKITFGGKDWDIAKDLLVILHHLNESAQELSRQKLPTIGLVIPVLTRLRENLEAQDGSSQSDKNGRRTLLPEVMQFKDDFAEDMQGRWDMLQNNASSEMKMSAFLDPRTKDFGFVIDKDDRQRFLEEMQEMAKELVNEMSVGSRKKDRSGGNDEEEEESDVGPSESPATRKRKANIERLIRVYGKQVEATLQNYSDEADHHSNEVERYVQATVCPLVASVTEQGKVIMSDPLAWWREHQHEYPRLAKLARRYLCIMATSVPCERAFSKAGWIVNKRRCALSDDHISTLLFVSFNQQHNPE